MDIEDTEDNTREEDTEDNAREEDTEDNTREEDIEDNTRKEEDIMAPPPWQAAKALRVT